MTQDVEGILHPELNIGFVLQLVWEQITVLPWGNYCAVLFKNKLQHRPDGDVRTVIKLTPLRCCLYISL